MSDQLVGQTIDLLQTLIRNQCVNDGTPESGHEVRSADVLQTYLEGPGVSIERFEPAPNRVSLVARIEGFDRSAPSLCLMGHTDVVPVDLDGWTRDPFSAELLDGEVWGRGAIDMLNLTASMAVAIRHLADRSFRPRGDLIYLAVADEEAGSKYGAKWLAEHVPDSIRCDYLLTESGGLHSGSPNEPFVSVSVGEKGVAWRRLRVRGTPGHGSAPFRSDNALVKAAMVVQRLNDYAPSPRFHDLWRQQLESMTLDDDTRRDLLDPNKIDDLLNSMPDVAVARQLHACSHTTFSCNTLDGTAKTNTVPSVVDIGVDVRTLPGETEADVMHHLEVALGPLMNIIEVEPLMNDTSTMSRINTPMWDAVQRAICKPFPAARSVPQLVPNFTDARVFRSMGTVAYGVGLFSPEMKASEFGSRLHGNDERVDVESLRLTTQFWLDVVQDMLG